MTKMEYADQLRAVTDRHYNCAQAVTVTFAEECGLTQEQAFNLGSAFGAGMKMGSVCGAITGGLMVLGLRGASEETCKAFMNHFRTEYGAVNCADLLRLAKERGNFDKKAHCDHMVREAVRLAEEMSK